MLGSFNPLMFGSPNLVFGTTKSPGPDFESAGIKSTSDVGYIKICPLGYLFNKLSTIAITVI